VLPDNRQAGLPRPGGVSGFRGQWRMRRAGMRLGAIMIIAS
jgi:hypothetical protein